MTEDQSKNGHVPFNMPGAVIQGDVSNFDYDTAARAASLDRIKARLEELRREHEGNVAEAELHWWKRGIGVGVFLAVFAASFLAGLSCGLGVRVAVEAAKSFGG